MGNSTACELELQSGCYQNSGLEVRTWRPVLERIQRRAEEEWETGSCSREQVSKTEGAGLGREPPPVVPIDTCVVSFRSTVFKDLYDQTSACSQRALYSWMASTLREASSATGEPVCGHHRPPEGPSILRKGCRISEGGISSSVSLRIFTCPSPNLQKSLCGSWNKTRTRFISAFSMCAGLR